MVRFHPMAPSERQDPDPGQEVPVTEDLDLTPWSGRPEGDEQAWTRRYAPLVRRDTRLRETAGAGLSVVVVSWRTPRPPLDALDAIRASAAGCRGEVEVILLDNGGLEQAREGILERVDRLVEMVGNVRLCRARNLGAALARGRVVVFLDDDGVIETEHLPEVERWFADGSVTAVRGRIRPYHHPWFTTLAEHYDLGDEPRFDYLVTEGNMAIRRDAYLEVGGFHELLAGGEGVDLTFRLLQRDAEARLLYAPGVVLRHDFLDGWAKFRRKFSHYAGMNSQLEEIDPRLGEFVREYARRDKVRPRLALAERVAFHVLTRLKKRLQRRARKRAARA